MSVYQGTRTPAGCMVTVDGEPLDPRLDLRDHSPTGFNWGYSGSGPTQLALAILAHHFTRDDSVRVYCQAPKRIDLALGSYQAFKWDVISNLPDTWEITSAEIDTFLDEHVYIPF